MVFGKDTSPIQKGMFGKHHSPETRMLMKAKHKGQIPVWAGKPMPEAQKIKIKKALKEKYSKQSIHFKGKEITDPKQLEHRRQLWLGKKNPNWQGGKERLRYERYENSVYKRWRRAVYKRDEFSCQKCHSEGNGTNLRAHHIQSYKLFPALRFEITNGITLCDKCHTKYHHLVGHKGGVNHESLKFFLC
jgi:hypothetical protein